MITKHPARTKRSAHAAALLLLLFSADAGSAESKGVETGGQATERATGAKGESSGTTERAAEILASMFKAYGGEEALRKVRSVTAKGVITDLMTGKSGSYARYFERPRRLRIEVMPEQAGEVRVLNGGRAWQATSEGFLPVSELELQSMLYQYSYLNLPMGLASGNYHARYGGKQTYKGRETYLLLVELKNAPRLGILVDSKSSMIVRIYASFGMMGGTGELSTEYGDYRPVAGVQFPYQLTSFAGGIRLAQIVLDEIAVNRKIPPELFSPKKEPEKSTGPATGSGGP